MITLRRRTAGALAGILLAALALRLSTFSQVFLPGGIRFIEPDAYYHMRRIVLAAGDFPGIISFDTYIDYPQGFSIGWPPLFDGIVAACAALLGLGDPSVSLVETVGALFPVVIGLLTVIPVYLIAREIFSSEEIGIAAAGILAILPAHVIASLLGFVDHHVVETFLFSLMILFHVLALRRPERLYHWSALLGAAFLAAIYSFPGAPIYVGSIGLILIGQFVLRRMRDLPSRDLLRFGAIAFGIAAAVSLVVNAAILGAAGFSQGEVSLFQPAYLFLWLGAIAAAGLLAEALSRQPWPVYAGALAGGGAAGAALIFLFARPLWNAVLGGLGYLAGRDPILGTIVEANSILFPEGSFSLVPLLDLYSVPLILAVGGLGVYLAGRRREGAFDDADLLLAGVLLISFALAVYQMRFLYVLALPVAISAGYGTVRALEALGIRDLLRPAPEAPKRKKRKNEPVRDPKRTQRAAAVAIFALILIAPTAYSAAGMQYRVAGAPSDDWIDALRFLRDETPDPGGFTDPSVTPAYGVMSFWDRGNLIIYEGKRPVVTNNFQAGIHDSVRFFTTVSEDEATAILDRRQVRYVITESMPAGGFANFLIIGGTRIEDLTYDEFYEIVNNSVYFRLHYRGGEGLSRFRQIYASPAAPGGTAAVKIFEYVP